MSRGEPLAELISRLVAPAAAGSPPQLADPHDLLVALETLAELGPVGVGKTFVANALGHVACRSGFNVMLHRGDHLLRLLRQSRLDNSREVLMTALFFTEAVRFAYPMPESPVEAIPLGVNRAVPAYDGPLNVEKMRET